MFADFVSDSPWANRPHRGWTTLASFAVQAFALASLLLLPFLRPGSLPPSLHLMGRDLIAPSPPPALGHPRPAAPRESNLANGRLIAPPQIPREVRVIQETAAPPQLEIGSGVLGGTGSHWTDNPVFNAIANSLEANVAPPPKPAVTHSPRVSRIMEGNLIHRVQPEYPFAAKMARVQGAVVLRAIISKNGAIENLQVVSGSPLLIRAAVDAVRQWQYRPYYLNDEPVEVDTQITVNFVLSGG